MANNHPLTLDDFQLIEDDNLPNMSTAFSNLQKERQSMADEIVNLKLRLQEKQQQRSDMEQKFMHMQQETLRFHERNLADMKQQLREEMQLLIQQQQPTTTAEEMDFTVTPDYNKRRMTTQTK